MAELKKLAEQLVNLTVKDVKELGDILKDEYGIEPAAAAAVAVAAPVAAAEEEKEEKSIFNVVLKEAGASKLAVIKLLKTMLNLGLKEAKDLVDSAPQTLQEQVAKDQAEDMKKKLEDAGAKVELA